MIAPDAERVRDLKEAVARCRYHAGKAANENARQVFVTLIERFEALITELSSTKTSSYLRAGTSDK